MSATTRWWWIRHAPVTSANGRIYGQMDMDCDTSDTSIYDGLAALLPQDAIWVTSNLIRTTQTAEAILARRADPAPELHPERELAEQSFGDWQGRHRDELIAERGEQWNRFWLAPAHEAPPGGESFADLIQRVGTVVDRLSRTHAGRDVVAVTHGGTIRAALARALDLEPERALSFVVDNCALTRIDHIAPPADSAPDTPPAWRVALVNHVPRA
ncbi:histidine phosphatase family protein [Rhodovibrio salinarum]|uniref:Histidine phosphatase family protein n=1 Tax=Rhodovibrio salinarum TaxID=1087 RepID=A0A934UZP7_9PROT|nr:histidine phosphatase family protein [Rhodovibrio salinarum]MBK1696973.1 histidine phosphatase family protein [Rhodovibrio salinarum]